MSTQTNNNRQTAYVVTGLLIITFLSLPPMRELLEKALLTHTLGQIVLLIFSGWMIGKALKPYLQPYIQPWNTGGIPGLLIVIFTSIFWMLPRSLDGALESSALELAKFITIPLGIGLPLAMSWAEAHILVRGFLKANFISMLGALSWVYWVAPIRICNNYLQNEQQSYGLALAVIAFALAILWGGQLLIGTPNQRAIATAN